MAIEVKDDSGEVTIFDAATGFKTEEEYNNLEVIGPDGSVVAAYAGGKWARAFFAEDVET